MKKPSGGVRSVSKGLHPRNRHQGLYDFDALIRVCPELKSFVVRSPRDELTIDFANPAAVMTLNRALLKSFYDVSEWEIPKGYLCPPVPGRADFLHYLADLLASSHQGEVPRGKEVRVLDIGVGANCIYPIIGHHEYGWSFVGTETDPVALRSAQKILEANPKLSKVVELRLQKSPPNILKGIIGNTGDFFELVMCNPPFHASWEEAQAGSERKWKNLGRAPKSNKQAPVLNFGGKSTELWCPGGEVAFVRRMIEESEEFAENVLWFSSLVSKETTLPAVHGILQRVGVTDVQVIDMAQGQKKSRILAWTFSPR